MNKASKLLIKKSREAIAGFLPTALENAYKSYSVFMNQDVEKDAKSFNAHHTAAKVAIAHIELLIKLAALADLTDAEDYPEIQDAILQAEEEFKKIKNEEEGE